MAIFASCFDFAGRIQDFPYMRPAHSYFDLNVEIGTNPYMAKDRSYSFDFGILSHENFSDLKLSVRDIS